MVHRLILAALALFWGAMMFLLWRAEFGSGNALGSSLPVETVWQRVLTAPDDSSLVVQQKGKRLGTVRWSANVGQIFATGKATKLDGQPEGRVLSVSEYTIDFDGTIYVSEGQRPYRFDSHLRFATNQTWQELALNLSQRPNAWRLKATAATEALTLGGSGDDGEWERQFTFAQLRQPEKILAEFGLPWAMGLLSGGLGLGGKPATVEKLSLGLAWEARLGQLSLGKTGLRCYVLSARLLDRYRAVIYVSRVGEILRVELPNEIVLMNEKFMNL
ncbi:MAG: hypothetical protein HY301_10360 [Verrucomicrobia bacterium]|nr:hypothetical protein [Verrucomicrobiota bacterium]